MYPFTYSVIVCNPKDNTYYKDCGMGLAESFTNAAAQIERVYGDDLVSIDRIFLCESCDLIPLPKHICDAFERGEFDDSLVECSWDGGIVNVPGTCCD